MKKYLALMLSASVAFALGCSGADESVAPTADVAPNSVAPQATQQREVVVYSARKEHLVKPLFDQFTKETGIEVKYTTDKAEPLLERIKAEGESTPADMLITVDAGNLWHAAQTGVLAKMNESALNSKVPAQYRDEEGRWFGLSLRARTIVYATDRVQLSELNDYENLADAQWQGKLCLRTSKKVYNQSLVAMLIEKHGEAKAEQIVSGWVSNLSKPPTSNDTKVMESIIAGDCDVGIVNTYYFGRLMRDKPESKLALFWPNQSSSGVHVNVSGAGITKHAKHPAEATQLLTWLLSEQAQNIFASLNMEYPVVDGVDWDPVVTAWGKFKTDSTPLTKAGENQRAAVMLMDRAGYR